MPAAESTNEAAQPPPRKLKVLMIHGYTQSGPLFHAKTRSLEKILHKAFPPAKGAAQSSTPYPGGIALSYPTGPLALSPADIPGYVPSSDSPAEDGDTESYGWWRRETGGKKYAGLEQGLEVIAGAIREAGGVDGVIGFSQGGAATAFVASLLEPGREASFSSSAGEFSYPDSFKKLLQDGVQGPLKFAAVYSGFLAPADVYRAFYEPRIKTPTLHFIGGLDTVVEESRSTGLADACEGAEVIRHPGGHFVPTNKEMAGYLVGFMRKCLDDSDTKVEQPQEESVEDMDVPF